MFGASLTCTAVRSAARVARAPALVRSLAAAAPAITPASAATDEEHQAWLAAVRKYPVAVPHFEWTLEWMVPTPVPLHTFVQTPVVIEVKDRNKDADSLVYMGPNVVGGYAHPVTGKVVSQEEHPGVVAALNTAAGRGVHKGANY